MRSKKVLFGCRPAQKVHRSHAGGKKSAFRDSYPRKQNSPWFSSQGRKAWGLVNVTLYTRTRKLHQDHELKNGTFGRVPSSKSIRKPRERRKI